jgi:hypothetical protein
MATQYSGGTYINFSTFSGVYKCLIMQGVLQTLCTNSRNPGWTNISLGAGLGPGNVSAVTVTTGTPGVINWTAHGFLGGEKVCFQVDVNAGGTYYTNAAANTIYYVKYLNANQFYIATTLGGANLAITGSLNGATMWCYSAFLLVKCVVAPNVTNPIVVRVQDNQDVCVCFSIQNTAGTLVGTNGRYNGAGIVPQTIGKYQITATQYWFYLSLAGAYTHHDYCYAGMLYVPSFITGVTDQGFLLSNSADSDNTNVYNSFRNTPSIGTNTSNSQWIWNTYFVEVTNNSSIGQAAYPGCPNIICYSTSSTPQAYTMNRWVNDNIMMSDVLAMHGNTLTTEGLIRGQFFDMVYTECGFMLDATETFGGSHTWVNITNSNTTGILNGSIWLATS